MKVDMAGQIQEYEHKEVPLENRHSLLSVTLVWVGFPLVVTGAFLGGQLTQALGFKMSVLAILLGNFVLFSYVSALSIIAAKTGKSFSLLSHQVFGIHLSKLVSVFLSTLVVGWFAVQTGLAGQGLHDMLGWSAPAISLISGIIFTILTLFGVRILGVIGAISVPLFLIFGTTAVIFTLNTNSFEQIINFTGNTSSQYLSLGIAITLVISLFIDSGTLTADFTRWAKNPLHAFIATASAFPLANASSMILGAIVVAGNTSTDGNFVAVVANQAPWLILIAALFFVINCASVTMHCLYNAATGWSVVTNQRYIKIVAILGVIGSLIATAGIWDHLIKWLSLLGIVVPGIGGVMIAHFFLNGLKADANPYVSFGAWGIAIITASLFQILAPQYSVAVIAMITSATTFLVLEKLISKKN
ncbi:purine-cytosine permease family protein [Acinetobacter venetianus]|jgi:cytosine permease|uniref:purine-cytosine permease family protein n=1 Tax=Acinetobacter venetianus TaxID=52133 RepID=UPI00289B833E|nr:cytosine permease [Acinetobacter venetianus]